MSDEIPIMTHTITSSEGSPMYDAHGRRIGYWHDSRFSTARHAVFEAIDGIPLGTYKPKQGNSL